MNLDGGGSTQVWEDGYINSPSETYRSVANHLGVYAENSSGRPNRPGHCNTQSACRSLPAGGGIIDNESACFLPGGRLSIGVKRSRVPMVCYALDNVFSSDVASNWAWWQLDFEESGSYELECHATVEFAVHQDVRHLIVADGQEIELTVR